MTPREALAVLLTLTGLAAVALCAYVARPYGLVALGGACLCAVGLRLAYVPVPADGEGGP